MRRLLILLFGVALAAAACGSSDTAASVAGFSEIAASEPVFTFDPSASTARLEVETTVRTVCAVAYGETMELGALATDQDMDAAGHTNHGPVLRGLAPDTTYFYRLQGVGADGTLYQSELLTFTTPTVTHEAAGANLAVSATVVEVSSEFSSAFAASHAIDGNPSTEWSTRSDGDEAFITIDLGSEARVTAIRFVTREMSDGSSLTTSFSVTVDEHATYGPFDAGRDAPLISTEFTGRVLRFDVESSTGGNTGAVEIEIYGE